MLISPVFTRFGRATAALGKVRSDRLLLDGERRDDYDIYRRRFKSLFGPKRLTNKDVCYTTLPWSRRFLV